MQPSFASNTKVVQNLAVHEAAVARVDAHARALSPASMADAQANLLCAQEAARDDDRRIREQDLRAVRARQAAVLATQRALDLELTQVSAASEAASSGAARIADAGAALRASHVDDVRMCRAVIARLPAPASPAVSGDASGTGAAYITSDNVSYVFHCDVIQILQYCISLSQYLSGFLNYSEPTNFLLSLVEGSS